MMFWSPSPARKKKKKKKKGRHQCNNKEKGNTFHFDQTPFSKGSRLFSKSS
jgi:hypothetical protein